MEAKHRASYFEDARPLETRRAASSTEKLSDLINSSGDGSSHIITHPSCYDCGSLMVLLHDGKFCPACGRLVIASDGWKVDHLKYSGVA